MPSLIPANCEETVLAPGPLDTVAAAIGTLDSRSGLRARMRVIFASGQNRRVDLARVGWIVTVVACLVAVLILLLQGYYGYALVTFAVAVSAAFNLT